MPSMVRHVVTGLVFLVAAAGCAARGGTGARSAADKGGNLFASEEEKLMACLDLRDHIVDLYADEYVAQQGLSMSREERTVFRQGWAEELARKGTFERFEQSCSYSLTPRKYQCGMASQSTDGLVACMRFASR